MWSRQSRIETDYVNRLLMSIISTSMVKPNDKEKLIRKLTIENEDLEKEREKNEYENLEVIGGSRSR